MTPRRPALGKSVTEAAPHLVSEWSSYNVYTPDMVSVGSRVNILWECPVDDRHFYVANVVSRSIGRNCTICSGSVCVTGFNDIYTQRPDMAAMYSDKNAIMVDRVAVFSGKKYLWKCAQGHEWETTPARLQAKKGVLCPVCRNAVVSGQELAKDLRLC